MLDMVPLPTMVDMLDMLHLPTMVDMPMVPTLTPMVPTTLARGLLMLSLRLMLMLSMVPMDTHMLLPMPMDMLLPTPMDTPDMPVMLDILMLMELTLDKKKHKVNFQHHYVLSSEATEQCFNDCHLQDFLTTSDYLSSATLQSL